MHLLTVAGAIRDLNANEMNDYGMYFLMWIIIALFLLI